MSYVLRAHLETLFGVGLQNARELPLLLVLPTPNCVEKKRQHPAYRTHSMSRYHILSFLHMAPGTIQCSNLLDKRSSLDLPAISMGSTSRQLVQIIVWLRTAPFILGVLEQWVLQQNAHCMDSDQVRRCILQAFCKSMAPVHELIQKSTAKQHTPVSLTSVGKDWCATHASKVLLVMMQGLYSEVCPM